MNMTAPDNLLRLYSRPGFLLRRAHQISAAVFEDECRLVGLTPAQFGVLMILRASPGLDQSSLSRSLGFDKVTVLRVLRGLEERRLVERSIAEGNRRKLSLRLTTAGLAAGAARATDRPAAIAHGQAGTRCTGAFRAGFADHAAGRPRLNRCAQSLRVSRWTR